MNYSRVCPRDLFNESKLLKCLGFISLKILNKEIIGLNMTHENEREGFVVQQNEMDGSIYVENLYFFDDNGNTVHFYHPLNAKDNFPLLMNYKDETYFPLSEIGELLISKDIFCQEVANE